MTGANPFLPAAQTAAVCLCIVVNSYAAGRFETVLPPSLHVPDTLHITSLLDSATTDLSNGAFQAAIAKAEWAYNAAEHQALPGMKAKSALILARAFDAKNVIGSALEYYLHAITVLESEQDTSLLAEVCVELGDYYEKWELPERTLEYYFRASKLLEPTQNIALRIATLEKVAELNERFDHLKAAAMHYEKLRSIYAQRGDIQQEASLYRKMSEIYRDGRMYDEAIRCSKEACMIYYALGDTVHILQSLSDIGRVSRRNNNPTQAADSLKQYIRLADLYYRNIKNGPAAKEYTQNLLMLGSIYEEMADKGFLEDHALAADYYRLALDVTDPGKLPRLYAKALYHTGVIHGKAGRPGKALRYLDLALFYAQNEQDAEIMSLAQLSKANILSDAGNYREALAAHMEYAALKEKLHRRGIDTYRKKYLDIREHEINTQIMAQRESMIREKERQELALQKLQLKASKRDQDLMILRQERTLQQATLENERLERIKLQNEKQLLAEQLKAEEVENTVKQLQREQEMLEAAARLNEARKLLTIERLEKETADAELRQEKYVLSIALFSIVLLFMVTAFIQKQRHNRKLRKQKRHIEYQADQLKRANQKLEMLNLIGLDITSNLLVESIADVVYDKLNEVMDAAVFGIGVYSGRDHTLRFGNIIENGARLEEVVVSVNNESSLAVSCFTGHKEIVIQDFYASYQSYIKPNGDPVPGDGNASSIIYLPLMTTDVPNGVITVQSFKKNAFNSSHLNLLRNIALFVKIAMDNAGAYEQIAEKSEVLKKANAKIQSKNRIIEKQNQQLISINKEKNHLIGILAHDLRNPLAMSSSMLDFIMDHGQPLSAERQKAALIILKALQRMNHMIEKILDVKAIESSDINLEMTSVDLREIVAKSVANHQERAAHKHIRIETRAPEVPRVLADPNFLQQIADNLVSNALKFSGAGTRVQLVLAESGSAVHLEVRDQGPGISRQDKGKMFGKYQKLSARPTAGEPSTGLGLSIVKRYVELMNGKVWCESEPGHGASFVVAFEKESEPVV